MLLDALNLHVPVIYYLVQTEGAIDKYEMDFWVGTPFWSMAINLDMALVL